MPDNLPTEYTRPMVVALLDHWQELSDVDDELLIVMRSDIELRCLHLPRTLAEVVSTVMAAGIGIKPTVRAAAVTDREVTASVATLLQILNCDGLAN